MHGSDTIGFVVTVATVDNAMRDKDTDGLVLATAVMAASIGSNTVIHDKHASGLTLATAVTVAPSRLVMPVLNIDMGYWLQH